jgi:hypothetical protein
MSVRKRQREDRDTHTDATDTEIQRVKTGGLRVFTLYLILTCFACFVNVRFNSLSLSFTGFIHRLLCSHSLPVFQTIVSNIVNCLCNKLALLLCVTFDSFLCHFFALFKSSLFDFENKQKILEFTFIIFTSFLLLTLPARRSFSFI